MREYTRRELEREEEDRQFLEDERRRRDREEQRRNLNDVSRNLEPEFMQIQGARVYHDPFANVYELATNLERIQNPTPDQERMRVILQATRSS